MSKEIGKYVMTGKILGNGQTGIVYEGYDPRDGTQVAIKKMDRSKVEGNDKLVRSLGLEIAMSNTIFHENIVHVYHLYVG